jgi:hypothetical protein
LRNTWVSQWRKTRLELSVADIEDVAAEPLYDWERQRTDFDLSTDMQWALDQLPEAYRWAVLLADVEAFTYQEIAATMECPVGTVMSRISRGRRMLGRLLNERKTAARPPMRIVARMRIFMAGLVSLIGRAQVGLLLGSSSRSSPPIPTLCQCG